MVQELFNEDSEQCCHDPDPSSSDLTLIDVMICQKISILGCPVQLYMYQVFYFLKQGHNNYETG